MKLDGLPFIHQIEMVLAMNRVYKYQMASMEMLDLVFYPWESKEIDLTPYLFQESELGQLLLDAFLPKDYYYDLPEDVPPDVWDNQVVKPFKSRYNIA